MPALANPKQEKFAELVAKGNPVWMAYRDAGFQSKTKKDLEANGFRLYRQIQVTNRIKELQHRNAAKLGVGVEQIVKELDGCLRLAKRCKQPAAAVGAVMGKAKVLGLITDRVEQQHTLVRKPMREPGASERMSMDDWKAQFAPKLPQPDLPLPANDDEDAA
jgi:phage terminase small subunit